MSTANNDNREQGQLVDGAAAQVQAPADLAQHWRRLRADDVGALQTARSSLGVQFEQAEPGIVEDERFLYVPITVATLQGDELAVSSIDFALAGNMLVTREPAGGFEPFGRAVARMRRNPEFADSPLGIMHALLLATNDAAEEAIELISAALEELGEEVAALSQGVDEHGREIGVSGIEQVSIEIADHEALISRVLDSQLQLARAARYLRLEIDDPRSSLWRHVGALAADIDGVRSHADYEHDKVRFLQQSLMTTLDVKQNQIVKVFTIITAVFLPPTLIATFYGMNFSVMPELSWSFGFPATTFMTLIAALLPLLYIKRKGWLR